MRAIDPKRFDRFTVGVAKGLSRRSLVKRAIVGAVASIVPIASATRVSAEEQCYFRSGNPIVDDCRSFVGPLGQCGDHYDCLDFTCVKVMKPEGALCNDGQWSCLAGVCTAPDYCAGVECPDAEPCFTVPRCDPATGRCRSEPVVCDNDGFCSEGVCRDDACLIDGAVHSANDFDTGSICRYCDPGKDRLGWSRSTDCCATDGDCDAPCLVGACSDGGDCTRQDEPDGTACGDADVCAAGVCQSDSCLIDGVTYADGDFAADSTCRLCDIAKSRSAWTRSDACCQSDGDCDDGDPCSTGTCADGDCVQTPLAACCPAGQIACGGACVVGTCCADSDCSSADVCVATTCNPDSHLCVVDPITGCCGSDADCRSDDVCSTASCDAGTHLCALLPVVDCCRNVRDCASTDVCSEPHCNAERGTCSYSPRAGCCRQASDCPAGPRQTVTCTANVCLVADDPDWCAADADCGDSTQCHTARCDTTLGLCLAQDRPEAARCKVGRRSGGCRSGVCRLDCGRSRVECGGTCRSLGSFRSDAKNCGGCGNVCAGRRCRRGVCLA